MMKTNYFPMIPILCLFSLFLLMGCSSQLPEATIEQVVEQIQRGNVESLWTPMHEDMITVTLHEPIALQDEMATKVQWYKESSSSARTQLFQNGVTDSEYAQFETIKVDRINPLPLLLGPFFVSVFALLMIIGIRSHRKKRRANFGG